MLCPSAGSVMQIVNDISISEGKLQSGESGLSVFPLSLTNTHKSKASGSICDDEMRSCLITLHSWGSGRRHIGDISNGTGDRNRPNVL